MIHTIVVYFALAWTMLLFSVCAILVVRARSWAVRLLALDTATLIQVATLMLLSHLTNSVYYLDAALVLALLVFAGTLAAAHYYGAGKLFA